MQVKAFGGLPEATKARLREIAAATSNGIGVTKAPDGEYIGISDGTFAFDSSVPRSDGELKTQAAARIKAGDTSGAIALLNQAITTDTNDAEAHIYLEDQKVLASGSPYVTFVVATMATGTFTQKHQRQSAYSVRTPPSSRPTAEPPPAIAP